MNLASQTINKCYDGPEDVDKFQKMFDNLN